MKLLKEIAEEHEVDWDPSETETEFLKPHADLLVNIDLQKAMVMFSSLFDYHLYNIFFLRMGRPTSTVPRYLFLRRNMRKQ
jgi:hypothetical protein